MLFLMLLNFNTVHSAYGDEGPSSGICPKIYAKALREHVRCVCEEGDWCEVDFPQQVIKEAKTFSEHGKSSYKKWLLTLHRSETIRSFIYGEGTESKREDIRHFCQFFSKQIDGLFINYVQPGADPTIPNGPLVFARIEALYGRPKYLNM